MYMYIKISILLLLLFDLKKKKKSDGEIKAPFVTFLPVVPVMAFVPVLLPCSSHFFLKRHKHAVYISMKAVRDGGL